MENPYSTRPSLVDQAYGDGWMRGFVLGSLFGGFVVLVVIALASTVLL